LDRLLADTSVKFQRNPLSGWYPAEVSNILTLIWKPESVLSYREKDFPDTYSRRKNK
jgi:hypothetical protein